MSTNRISVELTAVEKADIETAIAAIRAILEPKMINLTPAERQQLGAVGDERLNWVHKVKEYMAQNVNVVPFYIDAMEHEKDFQLFDDLTPCVNQLAQLADMVSDTKLLAGYDIFQNSLAVYNYIGLLAEQQNVPGITPIYQDLRKEFPGKKGGNATPAKPTDDTAPAPSDPAPTPGDS